jgi:hypothetical protein
LRLVLPEKMAQNRVKKGWFWGRLTVVRLSNRGGIDPARESEMAWLGGSMRKNARASGHWNGRLLRESALQMIRLTALGRRRMRLFRATR